MTKASIQAVAREAGVSVSTVSRTFAKPDLVLPETRDRVMTAAEKLDYSVSRSAAALKSGQSFRIALLASETITTWFNANIFAGLDSALRPSGYDTVPYPMRNAAERHDFFADLPVRRNADAVIVSSFDIEPAEVERLKHMHVPIVGINIPSTDGFDAGVSIDDYAATRSAIEHLIALGHRHIARPEVNCLESRNIIKNRIRKRDSSYIPLNHATFPLFNGGGVQFLRFCHADLRIIHSCHMSISAFAQPGYNICTASTTNIQYRSVRIH